MTLSDLKPRGYHLSDVEPGFRGMPLRDWQSKQITSQAEAARESAKRADSQQMLKMHIYDDTGRNVGSYGNF